MCVLGHSINAVVVTLLTRAFGVTYLQLLKHYDCSPAAVAWVGALSITCNGIFGKALTSHEPHDVANHRQLECLLHNLFGAAKHKIRKPTKNPKAPHYWRFVNQLSSQSAIVRKEFPCHDDIIGGQEEKTHVWLVSWAWIGNYTPAFLRVYLLIIYIYIYMVILYKHIMINTLWVPNTITDMCWSGDLYEGV